MKKMINISKKTINLISGQLKIIAVFLLASFLSACVHTSSYVVNEKPQVLMQEYVVRLDPDGDGSQVRHFLSAHKQQLSAGVCEMFWSEEGTPNDTCIITNNGKVSLIIDYTQDEYGIDGYRVSRLKHVKNNKFYSHFYKNYWLLEPYTSP